MLEITGTDADGELLARPLNWDSNEEPPVDLCHPAQGRQRRRDRATAFWRGWKSAATATKPASSGGWNARRPERMLGVLREAPPTAGALVPIDRKARTEYALDKRDLRRRQEQ